MKDLKILSEMTTRFGNRNINELDFKTPAEFAAYKKKHKMRPGTVVKVAGKDKVVKDDKPKGKKMQITMDFQSSNKKDLERFADKYGLKVSNINNNPNYGLEAEFEGSEENLKRFMTSDDYGLDEKDFDDYAREYGDELDVDPKIDKQMATAAEKANMKMDRDEINGILKRAENDEPFADEVEEILMDKFKDMGSTGKKLKQKLDTIASYEMGIYDMTEKEKYKDLVTILYNRSKVLLNKNLKYLDRETKEDSINKVLMLLHEVADYTRNELHPLGIWDNELTLELKQNCYKLINRLYGFKSNFRL